MFLSTLTNREFIAPVTLKYVKAVFKCDQKFGIKCINLPPRVVSPIPAAEDTENLKNT